VKLAVLYVMVKLFVKHGQMDITNCMIIEFTNVITQNVPHVKIETISVLFL